jgi:hypothetical protein
LLSLQFFPWFILFLQKFDKIYVTLENNNRKKRKKIIGKKFWYTNFLINHIPDAPGGWMARPPVGELPMMSAAAVPA